MDLFKSLTLSKSIDSLAIFTLNPNHKRNVKSCSQTSYISDIYFKREHFILLLFWMFLTVMECSSHALRTVSSCVIGPMLGC